MNGQILQGLYDAIALGVHAFDLRKEFDGPKIGDCVRSLHFVRYASEGRVRDTHPASAVK